MVRTAVGIQTSGLRSLCVNTVTPVGPGPVRFILCGWRRADGPIADSELLKGMTGDYGKAGERTPLSNSN